MNAGHLTLADQQAAALPSDSATDADTADQAAFDRVIREHQPQITRLVRRLLAWPGESSAVDDVVQEVFLKAWVKRHQFRKESSRATWLNRIAINTSRNFIRQQSTWRRVVDQFATLVTGKSQPDRHYDQEELSPEQIMLRWAINRLKPADREIVVLRYLEERSPDEIALLTGKKRNTIDARLSRARKRLKELIEQREEQDGQVG